MTEQELTKRAREAFQRGEEIDESKVRKVILDSWKRSRSYGLTGRTADKRVIPREELEERINQRQLFYSIACPFMERLYDFTTDSGCLTAISDEEGYVLRVFGDKEIMSLAFANGLVEGCNRDERRLGTNGIGTALALGMPIQIFGEEHYFQLHHNWVCSGAPVFGSDGRTAGMVCVIGTNDKVSYHTLGMVASAAEAITRQMIMYDAYEESERIQQRMGAILETTPYGLVLLDKQQRISQVNVKASELLGIRLDSLVGRNIWQVMERTPENEKIIEEGVTDYGIVVENGSQAVDITMTVSPAPMGERVITFMRSETMRRKVTRFIGTDARYTFEDIIGHSAVIRDSVAMARVAARLSTNLLILGESGTGKEMVAQAIHNGSSRRNEPFISVKCGALPKNLIENELFGWADGDRAGRGGKFELADGGTLFLEDISAVPIDVQVKLLQAIQEGVITRVGSNRRVKVNVRVIAANSTDLLGAVMNNEFHADLYYRLNGLSIHIPALRDRQGDVRMLADYFLRKYSEYSTTHVTGFTEGAYMALESYSWPGNIRELENIVEHAAYVCKREQISRECLPAKITALSVADGVEEERYNENSIQRRERIQIEETLQKCNGNISLAADMLGISRRTMYRKMDKYRIDPSALRRGGR